MIFALLIVYVFLSYVYPGQLFPALAPYRFTYWVGITGLVFCMFWLVFKRSSVLTTLQFWFLLVFTLILALSRMLGERWWGAAVPAVNQFGPSLAMFLLTVCAVDTIRKMRIVAACVAVLSVILVAQGIAAYHFAYQSKMFLYDPLTRAEYVASTTTVDVEENGEADQQTEDVGNAPDDEAGEYDGSTLVRIRGLGLLGDPNDLALGIVMALPLLAATRRPKAGWLNMLVIAVPAATLVYGLFLTRSRGGAFALVVTVCAALSRRIGKIPALLVFVLLLSGGAIVQFASGRQLSISDESVTGRFDAWSEGLQMLKGQPLLGVGYGQFLEHYTLTAHNSFVLCFAETGLIGYFFWLGIIVVTVGQLRSLAQLKDPADGEIRRWAVALQLSLFAFLTAAFFLSRSFIPMLYLLIGLCLALVLIARREGRPVWAPSVPTLGTVVIASEVATILFIYLALRASRI